MNDHELTSLWKSQPLDAETVSLDTIRSAAQDFHDTIVRRNTGRVERMTRGISACRWTSTHA